METPTEKVEPKKEEQKKPMTTLTAPAPVVKEKVYPPNTTIAVKKGEKVKYVNSNDIKYWKENGWVDC